MSCAVTPPAVRIDNKHFYDVNLFPHLKILQENREQICQELLQALKTMVVQPDKENGATLSGVWCEDKIFNDFYNRTKNQQGWLHW